MKTNVMGLAAGNRTDIIEKPDELCQANEPGRGRDFGYDRGVFSYVPKRNAETNSTQGEAVSVISWNNLAQSLNPLGAGTNVLLQVDAGFIAGIAANVATAPAGYSVVIGTPVITPAGAGVTTSSLNAAAVIKPDGTAGGRIIAAMAAIKQWLKLAPANKTALRKWLDDNGYKNYGITNLELAAEFAGAREKIVANFHIN